jgi:nucleotide-binding universal stress UspA family protein
VRESRRPVLLVPPRAAHLAGQPLQFRRVLVPFDGSSAALRVMDHILALPHADTLEFVLFQAVTPPVMIGTPIASDDEEWIHAGAADAEQRLLALAEPLRQRGSRVEVRVVESSSPAEVILDAVRGELVELIAMTTRGAGGLRRIVLGSVAEAVARGSEVPVLLVTARAAAMS